MVTYYLDTSALLKLYLNEAGSDWLRHTLLPPPKSVIITTQLAVVEVVSAFNRRVREGTITSPDYGRLLGRFRDDCRDVYQLITLNETILNLACALPERHPLRAYDAVHLSTAFSINQRLVVAGEAALTLLSADDRLNAAAAAEGLAVDNPNDHP